MNKPFRISVTIEDAEKTHGVYVFGVEAKNYHEILGAISDVFQLRFDSAISMTQGDTNNVSANEHKEDDNG